MKASLSLALVVSISLLSGCSKKSGTSNQENLDRQFQAMMAGATLAGHSTLLNRDGVSGEERYAIDAISRIGSETWLIKTRMKLGAREIPFPIPVVIRWAGDTPVITLTDVYIPGVGTYTARVVLYRDQYAGTWSGKSYGGQLFGKIIHEHR
ncbi:MAG: hypothetical protein ABSH24_09095 [Bryobacteraceae bacterium]|jgi:hypothetical protein